MLKFLALATLFSAFAGCSQPLPEGTEHIHVVMKKWEVEPAEIRLKRGVPVVFHVSSPDVQHSFEVPELGINEPMRKGKPAVFAFTPEKTGEFAVQCGIVCGLGHDDMTGKIIVE